MSSVIDFPGKGVHASISSPRHVFSLIVADSSDAQGIPFAAFCMRSQEISGSKQTGAFNRTSFLPLAEKEPRTDNEHSSGCSERTGIRHKTIEQHY
jgi:hypothetical protein